MGNGLSDEGVCYLASGGASDQPMGNRSREVVVHAGPHSRSLLDYPAELLYSSKPLAEIASLTPLDGLLALDAIVRDDELNYGIPRRIISSARSDPARFVTYMRRGTYKVLAAVNPTLFFRDVIGDAARVLPAISIRELNGGVMAIDPSHLPPGEPKFLELPGVIFGLLDECDWRVSRAEMDRVYRDLSVVPRFSSYERSISLGLTAKEAMSRLMSNFIVWPGEAPDFEEVVLSARGNGYSAEKRASVALTWRIRTALIQRAIARPTHRFIVIPVNFADGSSVWHITALVYDSVRREVSLVEPNGDWELTHLGVAMLAFFRKIAAASGVVVSVKSSHTLGETGQSVDPLGWYFGDCVLWSVFISRMMVLNPGVSVHHLFRKFTASPTGISPLIIPMIGYLLTMEYCPCVPFEAMERRVERIEKALRYAERIIGARDPRLLLALRSPVVRRENLVLSAASADVFPSKGELMGVLLSAATAYLNRPNAQGLCSADDELRRIAGYNGTLFDERHLTIWTTLDTGLKS